MSDLRAGWERVAARLSEALHVLILLDYDGTLVPIAERPELARLSAGVRRALVFLRDLPGVSMGVVSGRGLDDLVSHVSVNGLWYVGNHGYEIRTAEGEDVRFYEPEDIRHLEAAREELARQTFDIPGVLLEAKGPILAVHFRQVEPSRVREVERAFFDVLERHHEHLTVGHGKRVLEARLRAPCTKGSAVHYICRRCPVGTLPLYFGDDKTDHDAFRELREVGITVAVGNLDPPLAHHVLPDPESVVEILGQIHEVLRTKKRP